MITNDILYILDISPLKDEALFTKWYARMDEDRKKKIDSMKPMSGKLLSLGAGVLLYTAMEDAGITDYVILTGEKGKPYIKDREDVFFNLSHSGEMVALALSGKEVGVDIERNKHFKDNLIRYVFTESDISLAKELEAEMTMDQAYTRLWTAKESIMKHSGQGISLDPKKIELFRDDNHPGRLSAIAEKYDCTGLTLFFLSEGDYQISLCSKNPEMAKVIRVEI